jgi:hypothetical protein
MQHALSESAGEAESASLRSLLDGSPIEVEPPSEQAAQDTSERATLDFTPEEAARFEAGKTDIGVTRVPDEDLGVTVDFDYSKELDTTAAPPRKTRYTMVPATGPSRDRSESSEHTSRGREWLVTGVIAVALLTVVGICIWGLMPASADQLFRRIERFAEDTQPPIHFSRWLDEFLERFPNDPRAERVAHWQARRGCRDLQQLLQDKLRSLSEPEKQYLEGMRKLDAGQTEDACSCFRRITEQLGESDPAVLGATDKRLLQCARFLLGQLNCPDRVSD